jgi:hypothetical protein
MDAILIGTLGWKLRYLFAIRNPNAPIPFRRIF